MNAEILEIKVTGLREIERELLKLEKKIATRVVAQSLADAAKPVIARARQNAESIKDSGATRLALRLVRRSGSFGDRFYSVYVAPNSKSKRALSAYNKQRRARGANRDLKRLRHFHLAEFGRRWGGDNQPGTKWLTRAYDSTARQVAFDFRDAAKKHLRALGVTA